MISEAFPVIPFPVIKGDQLSRLKDYHPLAQNYTWFT